MTATELRVQGIPVSRIAAEFGTPLYLYDADVLRSGYQRLRAALHPAVDIFLSLKANPNVSVCGYLGSLGAGAEISSMTELLTVRRAGIDPRNVIFLGPGKTRAELEACVQAGLYAIVCESLDEVRQVDEIAAAADRDVPVMLRVNPDFSARGTGLTMGGKPRQFGVDVAQLRGARAALSGLRRVRVRGIHAYLGTRFLKAEDIVGNTEQVLATAAGLADDLRIPLDTVDFGGGFGVAYFDNEKDLDIESTVAGINAAVEPFVRAHPGVRLINELGRYLTAWCGTYVVRVLYVKESQGERFAIADGGTNHHMAAVGVGSFVKRNFPLRSLTRHTDEPTGKYTVTGPLCTPNDVIGKKVLLPEVAAGDLLGVERSGAYGPSASPGHFLSHGFPAEVMVLNGEAHLIRDRDRSEDLLAKQHLIPFA
ncbi:type III PLP-dependent enzyme [Streptomyces marincola]|uniref:Diaminopimelate decarboxylase n=1 Tax=Streptomyces marincola TaxID=2878388 RepID=A0A1W7CVT1_9ACTN|nr:type III PLP-dependent enzyme [Streptomyces marincola]ARQ68470.1 diaminopimelate decarboxylase [Streptomyces marincola]